MTDDELTKKSKEFEEHKKQLIEDFVKEQIKYSNHANATVLYFIADFYYHSVSIYDDIDQHCETLRRQFRAGYCYFFAQMLKDAFGRGEVCWAAPFSHIVWVDNDQIAYDIEGVNESEVEYYIPISYLGNVIDGFKHVRGLEHLTTKKFVVDTIERYKKDLEAKETTFF